MVHPLTIKLNSNKIDGVPVTGTPVDSRTALQDTHLLGEFGGTGNTLKAGPRKQGKEFSPDFIMEQLP